MDVQQWVILWQMYCQGLFAMMEYFKFIEIHHLSIERQRLNYKAFSAKYFQRNYIRHDARWCVFQLEFLQIIFQKVKFFIGDFIKKKFHLSWANIVSCKKWKLIVKQFFMVIDTENVLFS